ncbi:MAG: CaiB/BaiF CoA transferase family protein, partial [Candidatus Binatia bacterium]
MTVYLSPWALSLAIGVRELIVKLALHGISVLEVANYVAGPFASLLLADLGAEVLKIEAPGQGDPFRGWGEKLYAATFCSLNRNKKSLTLDIRRREGQEIFHKLASRCDVLIENLRPGAMERHGYGYETLRASNPKIIYCSISGFGQEGPYRDRPGYDTVGQALSGLLSLLTDPEKPQGMGISLSDHLTGMYACYGILAALVSRSATGEGQRVETSLLRASLSFVSENAARYFETGVVPGRSHRTRTAGVFAFVDREGLPFVIHLSSPQKFWRALLEVVEKPEWADDPRFSDRKGRTQNNDLLTELLQSILRGGRREDWLRRLQERD